MTAMVRTGWPNRTKRTVIRLVIPILFGFLGSYYARFAFEAAAFVHYSAQTTQLIAPVTSKSSGKSGLHAHVVPYPGARELVIDVTGNLYARLDTYRRPGRDCLRLDIETGRGGVKRTSVPALFDPSFDTDRWQQCPDYRPSPAEGIPARGG